MLFIYSRFLFILINIFVLVNFSFAANEEIDSLENKLVFVSNSEKATILNKLSEYYLPVETNKSLKYAKEALQISITINDSVNLSLAYHNLGRFQASYDELEKAISYFLISLKISEQINYPEGLGKGYNSLGLMHWKLGENKKAITYFKLAQDYFIKINNLELIASTINNLGIIYVENQDYENGIKNFKKTLSLMKELGKIHKMATALNNIGYVYELMEDYESGLHYYSKSLKLADSLQLKWSKANSLSNIGNIYYKKGQHLRAIKHIDQSLLIAQEINAKIIILECTNQLSIIYSESGSYKKAFEYNKLHSSIKDSILNEKKNKQIVKMQTRYETEKKEKEIHLLNRKNEIAFLKINRQKNFNYFIISVVLFLSIIIYIIYSAYKAKQKINKLLQLKNQKITQQKEDIEENNTELEQQKEEINTQKDEIEKQRDIVIQQKEEIIDGIVYAKRIQNALSPSKEILIKSIPEYFILDLPQGIVSGDFYWFSKINNKIIIAVADCTGHGVPGAFMSMLGITMLNKIINEKAIVKPNEILDRLRNNVIASLHQTGKSGEANDGMDISLITIDKKNNYLEYAGANNSAYLYRNNELTEIFADKMPIGIYREIETPFSCQKMSIQTGDIIYLFTDGYADQFGGSKGRKFLYKNFKILLKEIHHLPMYKQKTSLFKTHRKWKENNEQLDDILIMGIKI